jgi:hypothetical protein
VANNSVFDVVVSGTPGASAVFVLSLDTTGTTVAGIGDLCLGFGAPHLISGIVPVDGTGDAVSSIAFHGLEALIGVDLAIQGFVFEGGELGFGNGLVFEVGA